MPTCVPSSGGGSAAASYPQGLADVLGVLACELPLLLLAGRCWYMAAASSGESELSPDAAALARVQRGNASTAALLKRCAELLDSDVITAIELAMASAADGASYRAVLDEFWAECCGGSPSGAAAGELVGLLAAALRLDKVGGWCYCRGTGGGLLAVCIGLASCEPARVRLALELLPKCCGAYCRIQPGKVYA